MIFLSPFKSPFSHYGVKSHSYESTLKNSETWYIISGGGVCFAFKLMSEFRFLNILNTRSPN